MYHPKTKEDPGLSIGNDAKKLGEMWVTALQMAGSLKRRLLWKEKYQKDLAASWAKGRLLWKKKKKKDDFKADPNKREKKKEEKDKEGEINEEQEDKDNKVEDNN